MLSLSRKGKKNASKLSLPTPTPETRLRIDQFCRLSSFCLFWKKKRPVLQSLHQRACITCSRRAGKKNRLPAKATQWCNANSPIDPLLYEMLDANQVSVRSVCWSLFRTEKAGTVRFCALQNGGARHAAWSTSFIKKKKKSDFQHSITKLNDIDHPTVKIIWLWVVLKVVCTF